VVSVVEKSYRINLEGLVNVMSIYPAERKGVAMCGLIVMDSTL
jgi:hypothetical protein